MPKSKTWNNGIEIITFSFDKERTAVLQDHTKNIIVIASQDILRIFLTKIRVHISQ